jgi:membrane protein
MIRASIQAVIQWFKRVVTQPRDELDRWQKAARFAYDLGRYGARQLRQDQAPQMAAALAFRTLFGLLPVLVVATILVKAIRGTEEFVQLTGELLASAGLDQVKIMPPSEVLAESPASSVTLAKWLGDLVEQAASINLAAVGWVGLVVIIYAAVGLMVTIENSFNAIYRAPEGRPWTRRVPLYWFILTFSPVAIGLATYLNNRVDGWIDSVEAGQWVLVTAGILWSLLFGWLFMFAVYTLIPNSVVAIRPALAGALAASVLLEIGKRTMGAYLENAFSISHLYGSLGLIPLFMFWVYLMWLVVLFGLEVSATLQALHGRDLDDISRKREATRLVDPASVLIVMEVITERFHTARPTTVRQIAEATSISETAITRMLRRLIDAGLIHRLDGKDGAVSLAKPPEHVSAAQLVEIGFRMVDEGSFGRRSALSERLRDAQKSLAADVTLATLVQETACERDKPS